jgi:hypothetical protein
MSLYHLEQMEQSKTILEHFFQMKTHLNLSKFQHPSQIGFRNNSQILI